MITNFVVRVRIKNNSKYRVINETIFNNYHFHYMPLMKKKYNINYNQAQRITKISLNKSGYFSEQTTYY